MKEITQLFKDWITALRSGNYQQTKSRLYDGTGFCCLGVACAVEKRFPWTATDQVFYLAYGKETVSPDRDTRDALGISNITLNEAMDMNDYRGSSFIEIADYLEKKAAEGTL